MSTCLVAPPGRYSTTNCTGELECLVSIAWPKTIKKNTNSTPKTSQTQRAGAYKVTSFLSIDCELSTNPYSRFLNYSLGPWSCLDCCSNWCYMSQNREHQNSNSFDHHSCQTWYQLNVQFIYIYLVFVFIELFLDRNNRIGFLTFTLLPCQS